MLRKIAVQLEPFRCKPQMHPLRLNLNGMFPFLQKNDVRDYLGSRIGFKGIIGKAKNSTAMLTTRCAR